MKYVYVGEDSLVGSIIPDEDPIFPGIPVEQRYSAEFLKHCIPVDDDKDVSCGMVYDGGEFHNPTPDDDPSQPIPDDPPVEHQTYTEKLDSLTEENTLLKAQIKAQTDRSDFLEDCIAEMAMLVYAE